MNKAQRSVIVHELVPNGEARRARHRRSSRVKSLSLFGVNFRVSTNENHIASPLRRRLKGSVFM